MRWKVLTLAHRTVGQTSESDHLRPVFLHLKWQDCRVFVFEISKIVEAGKIDPETIVTPGIFVSNLVEVPAPVQEEDLMRAKEVYP